MSKSDIYNHILPEHKPSRDWQAPAVAAFGVVLLITLTVIIASIASSQFRFNEFCHSLYRSTQYASQMKSFTLYDGDTAVRKSNGDQINYVILGAQAGRERKDLPTEQEGLTCVYGDGCVLQLWETEVTDQSMGHGKEMVPGTLVAFTDQDGKVYAYETKNIDYPNLRLYLIGESDTYYAPYLPDISPLLKRPSVRR